MKKKIIYLYGVKGGEKVTETIVTTTKKKRELNKVITKERNS